MEDVIDFLYAATSTSSYCFIVYVIAILVVIGITEIIKRLIRLVEDRVVKSDTLYQRLDVALMFLPTGIAVLVSFILSLNIPYIGNQVFDLHNAVTLSRDAQIIYIACKKLFTKAKTTKVTDTDVSESLTEAKDEVAQIEQTTQTVVDKVTAAVDAFNAACNATKDDSKTDDDST
jgi:hypothetical protein